MRKLRSASAAAFVVVCCALVGGLFGRDAVAQDQLPTQYRVFAEALAAVEQHYVGETETDRLVYSAISGMLQTLDPHSSFMDPRSYEQMRERQEGRYYGLGISISVTLGGDITVANVFEGSPAYQRGMRRGDVIAQIEGEDAKGWTVEEAVRRLRGQKGTSVNVSVRRTGYEKLIDLAVVRDEIHMPTVPAAFMLDETTGYLKLKDFGEHTDEELGESLRALTKEGMRQLVFDLRDNPGGALDQAIRVANRFLPRGDMIVFTRGRVQNSDHEYRATLPSDYLNIPIVTLVNRSSASASEIVAGALQDHDRALIVGETTFGKALVQSVFRLSNEAGAAITTARYYTPSGRLIQRPWDGTFDEYLTYTLREQDVERQRRPEDLKLTDSGRRVYSGGGIEPDHRLDGPVMGFDPTRFSRTLYARNLFASFGERFARRGDTRIAPSTSSEPRLLASDFTVTDAMLAEFKEHVRDSNVRIDEEAWARDEQFIRAMLRFEIDLDLFGVGVAWRNVARVDPQVQLAAGLFPEARKLLETSRQQDTIRRVSR